MGDDTFTPFPEPNDATDAFGVDALWREVRRYSAEGDGYDAAVLVARMPANFYRVESFGGLLAPLTTGSGDGMARLADSIAKAIASGMLGQNWGES